MYVCMCVLNLVEYSSCSSNISAAVAALYEQKGYIIRKHKAPRRSH